MALHQPPCYDANQHILRVRDTPEYAELDISVLIRLAVAEYERETAPRTIVSVDAEGRLREIFGWTESELRLGWGDR